VTDHYVVELELDTKPTAAAAEAALVAVEDFHPSASTSAAGLLEVTITLPAEGLRQAVAAALALVAPIAGVVRVQALPEAVRDAREGWDVLDDLVSAPEAAEILGVSRQRILQLIGEGKLPGRRIGREYAIPRAAVAARSAGA
jgi:excisionase family DNA binding protein